MYSLYLYFEVKMMKYSKNINKLNHYHNKYTKATYHIKIIYILYLENFRINNFDNNYLIYGQQLVSTMSGKTLIDVISSGYNQLPF